MPASFSYIQSERYLKPKGELKIDYRLQEYLDSKAKILPIKTGEWSKIKTSNGSVRINSLHGKNEKTQNTNIASYLANKYGDEIDLLGKKKNVKSPDAFNKTECKYYDYKLNSTGTYSSFDNAIRDGAKQANNLVISIDTASPISDFSVISDALHDRVGRCPDLQSIRLIYNSSDALYLRKDILGSDFKINEADFK